MPDSQNPIRAKIHPDENKSRRKFIKLSGSDQTSCLLYKKVVTVYHNMPGLQKSYFYKYSPYIKSGTRQAKRDSEPLQTHTTKMQTQLSLYTT